MMKQHTGTIIGRVGKYITDFAGKACTKELITIWPAGIENRMYTRVTLPGYSEMQGSVWKKWSIR